MKDGVLNTVNSGFIAQSLTGIIASEDIKKLFVQVR